MKPVNHVFVFGSNTEGRHGKGAALHAVKYYEAIQGQARGRQGNSYAIVTKEMRWGLFPITLEDIQKQLETFRRHSLRMKKDVFTVTAIGTGIAGFSVSDIKYLIGDFTWPDNVYFQSKLL